MAQVQNVSAAKPKIAGAVYRAKLGTALPTDATTKLDTAFKELGFVGEDGITNDNSIESDTLKAWGGTIVLTTQKEKTDTFKFKLIESLNTDVLSMVYGSDNVKGNSVETGIKVTANSKELESAVYVFEIILRGGIAKRIIVPEGKISELGEVVYKDDEYIGYEVTLTAMPDKEENTHFEYIKKASTTGEAA